MKTLWIKVLLLGWTAVSHAQIIIRRQVKDHKAIFSGELGQASSSIIKELDTKLKIALDLT